MTPRFEVDYRQRLEQQRTANNAVRLPLLGYATYRVYEIKESKGVSTGVLNSVYGSVGTGKSSYTMSVSKSRQSGKTNWQQIFWAFVDEVESRTEPGYTVHWLKTKQATLLRLKGHQVEPTTADDKSNIKPVRIGT